MQQLLLVDELGALSVHQLLPEVLVLQQLQHVQAVGVPAGAESQSRGQLTEGFTNITTLSSKRKSSKLRIKHVAVLEELGILRLLPVQQVLQVVDEGSVPQDASLSQNWKQTHKTYVKLWQM